MRKLIIIPFIITLIFTSCSKEKIEGIYDNPGYAIGEISYSTTIGLTLTYHYDFDVSGTEYDGKEKSTGIGQDDGYRLGKSYLVIYKQDNPDDNVIDYDYLIESEDDFEDLLEEFETNPPKQ